LLYIEIKTHRKEHDAHDREKILRFISDEYGSENRKPVTPYRFKYGVSILLRTDKVDFLWYKNGSSEPIVRHEVLVKSINARREKKDD
jgi:hypothetical protein